MGRLYLDEVRWRRCLLPLEWLLDYRESSPNGIVFLKQILSEEWVRIQPDCLGWHGTVRESWQPELVGVVRDPTWAAKSLFSSPELVQFPKQPCVDGKEIDHVMDDDNIQISGWSCISRIWIMKENEIGGAFAILCVGLSPLYVAWWLLHFYIRLISSHFQKNIFAHGWIGFVQQNGTPQAAISTGEHVVLKPSLYILMILFTPFACKPIAGGL